jgi:transcriptional regulator with PAS, ATPase and Fis domain
MLFVKIGGFAADLDRWTPEQKTKPKRGADPAGGSVWYGGTIRMLHISDEQVAGQHFDTMRSTALIESFLGMAVVVSSAAMRDLLRRVQRVAQTNAAVIILGESGAGKEVVARGLHHYSLRSAKPWVDVNCAALPDHLVESELFGYEKGAFSGAESNKQGLFELAHTGTIYLDEVGELDAKAQAKLLRVLDGVPYYRIGGTKKVSVDVRVLAATNQNIEAMIREGKFRGDLYHRLSQVCLRVPPLRERRDDVAPLAEFFLERQHPGTRLTAAARRALEAYSWPGNVRELRNLVTRAAVFADGHTIDASDLGLNGNGHHHGPAEDRDISHIFNLEELERRTILRVLRETSGHQQRAADILGISVRTLSRKLATYEAENQHALSTPGRAAG